MKPAIRNLMAGAALSSLLSACGGDDSVATPTPPPAAALTLAQQIGAAFNTLFTASADVEATEPSPSSVPPLDLNSEPITG